VERKKKVVLAGDLYVKKSASIYDEFLRWREILGGEFSTHLAAIR
jgi:hypothetical protein